MLAEINDPTWYCHAGYKQSARDAQSCQKAITKLKEGAVLIRTQMVFAKQTQSAYILVPKRDVVDFGYTTTEVVVGLGTASAVQSCPSATIGEPLYLK